MLATEVCLNEVTKIFQNFSDVICEKFWLDRVNLINAEIKGAAYLSDYLYEENHIAYLLSSLSQLNKKYGIIPRSHRRNKSFYPAITFIVQVLSLLKNLSETQKQALIGRVRGSFANPDDLRGLMFELSIALLYVKRGKSITWPEISNDGSPDFIVNNIGTHGLEVECKSISKDKGKKIRSREAIELLNGIRIKTSDFLENTLNKGGLCVVITTPISLSKNSNDRKLLVKKVMQVIESGESKKFDDGLELKLTQFDIALLNNVNSQNTNNKETRQLIDSISQTDNREAMLEKRNNKAILVIIQSASEDNLLKSIFDTLSKSSKKQFSNNRAATYMVQLDGMSYEELLELAQHDFNPTNSPTGLRIAVSKFLSSIKRSYIASVCFVSRGSIKQMNEGMFTEINSAYSFPVKESEFWHDDFAFNN